MDQITIEPNAIYPERAVQKTFGLTVNTLRAAQRNASLKAVKRGGRLFYFGSDLLAWFRAGSEEQGASEHSPKQVSA